MSMELLFAIVSTALFQIGFCVFCFLKKSREVRYIWK